MKRAIIEASRLQVQPREDRCPGRIHHRPLGGATCESCGETLSPEAWIIWRVKHARVSPARLADFFIRAKELGDRASSTWGRTEDAPTRARLARLAARAYAAAAHANRRLERLADAARDAGEPTLRHRPFEGHPALEDLATRLRSEAPPKERRKRRRVQNTHESKHKNHEGAVETVSEPTGEFPMNETTTTVSPIHPTTPNSNRAQEQSAGPQYVSAESLFSALDKVVHAAEVNRSAVQQALSSAEILEESAKSAAKAADAAEAVAEAVGRPRLTGDTFRDKAAFVGKMLWHTTGQHVWKGTCTAGGAALFYGAIKLGQRVFTRKTTETAPAPGGV